MTKREWQNLNEALMTEAQQEGDDAAERLRPEFRSSPAGQMKVQFV